MKKIIAAFAVVTMFAAGSAFAYKGVRNNGQGLVPDCPMLNQEENTQISIPQIDAATQERMAQFYADTAGLRKQMAMKLAEERALMLGDDPDPKKAAALAGELFDLRHALQNKASEAGIEWFPMMGAGMRGFHGPMGWSWGPHGMNTHGMMRGIHQSGMNKGAVDKVKGAGMRAPARGQNNSATPTVDQ